MNNSLEENLPLYLKGDGPPINAYIINNNVVYLQETECGAGSVTSALTPLMMLFSNPLTKLFFPEITHDHLNAILKEDWKRRNFCICGNNPGFPEWVLECLALKMTIVPKEDTRIVTLHDFALIERVHTQRGKLKVYNLPWIVHLTAEEAFLNFANINLSNNFSSDDLCNVHSIKEKLVATFMGRDSVSNYLSLFCLDYTEWLQNQLQTQTISCSKILQLSGADVLASLYYHPIVNQYIEKAMIDLHEGYSLLSQSQKIQYFLLLKKCEWNAIPSVEIYFKENESLFNNLRKELLTPYPIFSATKENTFSIEELFRRYGL